MSTIGARRFARVENDFYATTDPRAVAALAPHVPAGSCFVEPCAGDGALLRQLEELGLHCVDAFDIAPRHPRVRQMDALEWDSVLPGMGMVITNPPYAWGVLRPLLDHLLASERIVWLLLEAGFIHNRRSAPYMRFCSRIVSVGRLRLFAGTPHKSTKDYVWLEFWPGVADRMTGGTRFHGPHAA